MADRSDADEGNAEMRFEMEIEAALEMLNKCKFAIC
jgi:hypothetical protein